MKQINFSINQEVVNHVNDSKVNALFVSEIKNAFLMFPRTVDMRYKQSVEGKLVISLNVTYDNNMSQHFQDYGDADLISAILMAMGKDIDALSKYKAEEHDVEIAQEEENLVLAIFKQYMSSSMRSYIETDWVSSNGTRYRRITFSPSFNMNVKFCLQATEEVNNIINEACKPEWLKKEEAEDNAKAEAQPTEA